LFEEIKRREKENTILKARQGKGTGHSHTRIKNMKGGEKQAQKTGSTTEKRPKLMNRREGSHKKEDGVINWIGVKKNTQNRRGSRKKKKALGLLFEQVI